MQSKSRAAWLSVAGVALLVSAGCGDGDGDGGGGTTKPSGVAGSKSLSDVTDAEATRLCEWAGEASYTPTEKETCTLGALFFASTPAECEATVAECLKEEPTEDEEVESCDDASNDVPDTCTATVAELEACIKDSNEVLRDFFNGASCADAGMMDTGDSPGADAETPASCATINEKCPGLLDDDAGGGAEGP